MLKEQRKRQRVGYLVCRERVSDFSLSFRQIRPSKSFEPRRKVVLRGEGNEWTPDFRSFNKLREVGVSPYLDFILCLRAMLMFELNEAMRGRLIGSKSWNRGVGFLKPMWIVRDCPRAIWSDMVKFVL